MNDYSNAFHLAGPFWAEQGIATYAIDIRGFGRSPDRGAWAPPELVIEDLRTAVALVREAHPEAKVALAGVSMGGALAITAMASDRPPAAERLLQRIEFVPLDGGRVLVVVVAMNGEVAHKVVPFEGRASREQLIEAANYLTAEYGALPLTDIRERLLEEMQAERALYDALFARALAIAEETLASLPSESHVFVSGAPTIADLGLSAEALPTLRALLEMLEEKDRLARLLTAYLEDPGLTIVIGTEHLSPDLQSLSLVLTTCTDDARIGVVGILGPTRMRYSRAINAVDSVSHAMSRVFAS